MKAYRLAGDRSYKIILGTQELEPDKAGALLALNQHVATVYISSKEISNEDKEVIDLIEPDLPGKSPSQRLRAVLYLLWKQDNGGFTDKNLHYLHEMERIIEHYKGKLKE